MGSSPLTRGKHAALDRRRERRGIIPAHAGKTRPQQGLRATPQAHPRSRGENGKSSRGWPGDPGSSPLTRGKLAGDGVGGLSPGAHPRSRGENTFADSAAVAFVGSSPLTRGKPRLFGVADRAPGLIPAHAGKTRPVTKRAAPSRAHPRSRGENRCLPEGVTLHQGSSPLTRGKRRSEDIQRDADGLIPAHAGKTGTRSLGSMGVGAHPRSRGENTIADAVAALSQGSSPLTRGKHPARSALVQLQGIIPAHAGKTCAGDSEVIPNTDHPRSRGENRVRVLRRSWSLGSSPLTQGKRFGKLVEILDIGLIPAHAGKTPDESGCQAGAWAHPRSRGENSGGCEPPQLPRGSSPLTRGKRTDQTGALTEDRAHPRSRGENFKHGIEAPLDLGSSPLTRGKRASCGSRIDQLRLIPAHAGKTRSLPDAVTCGRAHPRSRGENKPMERRSMTPSGSSPLTRGKQCPACCSHFCPRLIPAHAGKTWPGSKEPHGVRAHPRSRGENAFHARVSHVLRWLIPAHAGKTSRSPARAGTPRAHPRSRGENHQVLADDDPRRGSSPLTRGKRRHTMT